MQFPSHVLSDFAAQRLDDGMARQVEIAAALDPDLAARITAVRTRIARVRDRLEHNDPDRRLRETAALAGHNF